MSKFKFYSAIVAANTLSLVLKAISKSSGTSFPGMVGLKICPDFLQMAQKYAKEGIVNITGTNGKTTTAGLLAHIINISGRKVLHNEKGANMLTGITSALLDGVGFNRKSDFFILESDEAYLTKVYDYITATYLLVTNLFRDQLDRYGELDTTFKKIQEAIDKNKKLKLVLNADDPMVSNLGNNNERIYYGFEDIKFEFETQDAKAPIETVSCPVCGEALTYKKRYYAHIGDYNCKCSYGRPDLKYKAVGHIYPSHSIINIELNGKEEAFKIPLPGLYNVYNALAAIAMALELDVSPREIQLGFDTYKSVFGRAERLTIKGKSALVQLIKNPVGATEVLRLIADTKKSKLLIVLNDNYADGRDVSWIWDADFELLKNYTQDIIVSGVRAFDMAVRLKYAGVNESQIHVEKDLKNAISAAAAITEQDETLLILPTYTALLKMQNIVKRCSFK
ncbi:MAG: Mur ligase family protein [Candidatus Gastranaerophilales bacterium]|nr:Mur ligase family protein [Candidatus Gastranaerophilales bacterium]